MKYKPILQKTSIQHKNTVLINTVTDIKNKAYTYIFPLPSLES